MIQLLNKLYVFFEVVPEPIPLYSGSKKVGEIPFINYHYNRLRGKVYKVDDDSKSLLIAFERNTATGKADLKDAEDNIPSSVVGNTLGAHITLMP